MDLGQDGSELMMHKHNAVDSVRLFGQEICTEGNVTKKTARPPDCCYDRDHAGFVESVETEDEISAEWNGQ
jgi:hypothetical protein